MSSMIPLLFSSPLQFAICLVITLGLSKLAIQAYKSHQELSHIPSIGPSGFFSSYIAAFRYLTHAQDIIREGCKKYPGSVFRVPTLDKWVVFISGPRLVEDLRKASDSQLSIAESANEILQLTYTWGDEIWMNPYHHDIIRGPMTRNIASRFPDIKDEVVFALSRYMPPSSEWQKIPIYDTALQIVARTTARFFIGLPLCRDDEYIDFSINITYGVFVAGFLLSAIPRFLRRIASYFLPNIRKLLKKGVKYLGPIVQHRLDMEIEYDGADWPEKPNDFISWLLDVKDEDRSIENLTSRVLATNIAAIHTTSNALSWALYFLAVHPELVPALREEVEPIIGREGWTKIALIQMRKLDSFVKESSRIFGSAGGVMRKVMQDFTFSDGTVVPKGYFVNIAVRDAYYDEETYPNADEFQWSRSSDKREQLDGESIKHQMITPDLSHLMFGIGKHACPGRFFAVNEVKLILAHILINYDVAYQGKELDPTWFIGNSVMGSKIDIMFRSRKSD